MKPFVFMLLFLAAILESALSQPAILERRVKMEMTEGTIGSLLDELGRKGGFIFSYGQDIRHNDHVTIKHSYQTIQQYLDEVFHGEVYCVEYGNKLMIKQKPELPEVYSIRGKVVDSGTRESLAGVTVYIPGTDPLIGSISDKEGNFRIHIPVGMDMVRFSCIGYESTALSPGHSARNLIELKPGRHEIDELIIEHFVKPVDEASNISVSYIRDEKLEKLPVASIDHMLQGAASGVHVTRNSGMPGASLQVKIRGNHSLINSEPVYYLDGIPVQQTSIHAISPHDIESIEVLKDASSTSIYGASAGNGVVLMNTRKGNRDKTTASLKYYMGQQQAGKTLDLMNTGEFLEYSYLVRPSDSRFTLLDSIYQTDWMKLMFHRAMTEDFHLSLCGGNEKSVIYTSSGYYKQSAIIRELEYKRYSFRINSDHTINSKLKIGQDLLLSHVSFEGLKEGCFLNDFNNPILSSMCMLPLNPPGDSTPVFMAPEVSILNPNDNAELNNNSRKNYAVLGNIHTSLDILPQIIFETRIGFEVYYQDNASFCRFIPAVQLDANNPVIGSEYNILDLAFDWQNRLLYAGDFSGGHSLNAMAVFEYGQSSNDWRPMQQSLYDKDMNKIEDPSLVLDVPSNNQTQARDFTCYSLSGSIQYSFRNRYYLHLLLRKDVVGYYWDQELKRLPGIFPSISLGWVFTEEKFFPRGSLFHYGKIRYGWGKAGNSPRMNYSFYTKMMRDMEYIYAFNSGGDITNSALKRQTNEKFYWENTSAHDLGLDLGFFKNRLFISVDYFYNLLNKGEKYRVDKPIVFIGSLYQRVSYGINYLPVAEIVNRGVEWNLNYKQTGRRFKWEFNFHFMHLHNKILDIEEGAVANLNDAVFDPISVNLPGEPAGSFYGYRIERLFTGEDFDGIDDLPSAQPKAQAGDYKFCDMNHDGMIDQNDKTIIGNSFPDFTFGLYSDFQFLDFDLSVLLQGTYGNEIFNATKLWLYNPYGLSNWTRDITNSYRSPVYNQSGELIDEGLTNTTLHRFDYYATNKNLRMSDFYVEDGSYLRVKNIQLGYTLKPELSRKIHIEKVRVFICTQNLFTLTRYSGLDPEVGGWGIDCGIYPQPRTYLAGVNIEF
ncbi:MAG: SusC/RagA family TonB-linked outer membrane protein [Bacteroidota bacterium]